MLYKLARAGLLLLCLAVGTALAEDYDKVYDEPDVSSTTNSHINLWTLGPEHDCMADIAGPIEEGHEAPPDGLVNVHDLLKILSGFGKYQDHAKDGFHKGDIDQNHEVDVDDLLFVLKHFDRNCKGFIRTLFG